MIIKIIFNDNTQSFYFVDFKNINDISDLILYWLIISNWKIIKIIFEVWLKNKKIFVVVSVKD